MWYVYFLKSEKKDWNYVGSTSNLETRFEDHQSGNVQSTKHYRPFSLQAYIALKDEKKARELEKYFKTGSGRAFMNKRIL